MNYKFLLLFVLISFPGICQELPPVTNFNPNQYNAGNQNWDISQNAGRNIYVANSVGLLEYTGAEWNLYPMPNNTIVRSVQVAGDKIFTGAYMEIGYWQKNSKGVLEYTSLMPNFPGEVNDGEQFWHMEYMGDVLVIQSFEGLYLCNLKTLEITKVSTTPSIAITNLFKGENSIYFQMRAAGLFTIKKNQPEMIIPPVDLVDIEIKHVFQRGKSLQLISRDGNFYEWDGQELKQNYLDLSKKLRNQSVFSAQDLSDNSLVLGTVEQGIYHVDVNGNILFHFNQKNGLINNTVLDLFVDKDDNLWAGLDNGLSIINLNSAFIPYQDNYGNLGSVYTSLKTEEFLYVGTNQGLFYKGVNDEGFSLMDGTNGQVWSLQLIGDNLFCGHNIGTYIINGNEATQIFEGTGTWVVKNYEGKPGYYLQGHYNGISLLKEENGNFTFMGMLDDFPHSTKFLISEKNGDVWTVNEHKGVYRIQVDFPETKVNSIENYTFENSGINSSIFKFNDTLYYSSKEKLFQFQESENKFNSESSLGSLLSEFDLISGKLVHTKDNVLWGFLNDAIVNIEAAQLSKTYKMGMIYLPKDLRNITLGYENITLLENNSYLLGVSNGYLKLEKDFSRNLDYEIKLDKVFKTVLDESPERMDLNNPSTLHYKTNNISFDYSIPEYKKFITPVYSYRLLGLSDHWSSWAEVSSIGYTNLSFGDYEFQVKAKMGDQELNPVGYSFKISRPWFLSYLAIALYVMILFIIGYFVNKWYKRKHFSLIEEKEKEMKLKNLEVEKRIIELQNEQLEKEMTGKNKELAISTMSLIKKNEFLSSIKDKLKESKETSEVRSVIRTIDKDISEEDNWNFFKEAFNNADKDFFKKMKTRHPNLTSNDLKLCAYLRLNLSSKEIAPLLNISVKSVEIKRYRLRKKMELTHDSNLVDYILGV